MSQVEAEKRQEAEKVFGLQKQIELENDKRGKLLADLQTVNSEVGLGGGARHTGRWGSFTSDLSPVL